jgi:heterodisulfide reductase subunit A-like polyferredoxin
LQRVGVFVCWCGNNIAGTVDVEKVAAGYDLIDLSKFGEYSYDHPNVITSLEFERLTNAAGPTHGKLLKLSDHTKPKKVVFVQVYCSRTTRYCTSSTSLAKSFINCCYKFSYNFSMVI